MTNQTNAAVKDAVQNTTKDGLTIGEVINNLDKSDLKLAYKSIDAAYDIQWGKGGVEDTQNVLKGLQGKIGEHVYAIAKRAMEHVGPSRLPIARSYFLALCDQAETHCKNKYIQKYSEDKPMGQLIPLWSNYKSSIAKGMEKGIDPNETMDENSDAPKYATAAQYRAAVQAAEASGRETGSQAGNTRNSEGQTGTALQLVTKGWSPKMSASMQVLCQALNGLTHEDQDKFAESIMTLAAEVTTYANTAKREAVGDTRTDAQRAVGSETTADLDPGTQAAMQKALDDAKATSGPVAGTASTAPATKRRGARAA